MKKKTNFTHLGITTNFKFHYVSKVSTENQLKNLSKNETCGVENLAFRLLKSSATIISKPLGFLLNLSFETGTFPQKWKTAKVTLLHKSGDPTNTHNYRPISVLPTLSNVPERVHEQGSSTNYGILIRKITLVIEQK